jgi:3-hydroxymyristoyl/3-hydroxydecanoyl-(acyl carrier protein) dehydratase
MFVVFETWHSIQYKGDPSAHVIEAEACVEAGSPWFSGHFPDEPILPGIAILAMAAETITKYEGQCGNEIKISSIKRVRFKLPVKPRQPLSISLSPVDKLNPYTYQFRVATRGETICTGVLIAEELRESKKGPDLF